MSPGDQPRSRPVNLVLRLKATFSPPGFKPVSVGRLIYRAGLSGIAAIERGRRER